MTQKASDLLYTPGSPPQTQLTGWDDDTSSFNVVRVDTYGRLHSDQYVWDPDTMMWVAAEGGGGAAGNVGVLNAADVRIDPATDQTLAKLNGFSLPVYDYMDLVYTGSDLTSVVYKTGGSSGTTVATLTLGYSGSNLVSVTRS